jgi:hypothetical protein
MNVLIFNCNTGYKQGGFENSALITLGSLNSVFFFSAYFVYHLDG